MAFYYLLLGHFMGDFIFQTDKIALKKSVDTYWRIIHVIIVTVCMLIFAAPFGKLIIGLTIINGLLHFIIDTLKKNIISRVRIHELLYFILDQLVHISLIWILTRFAGEGRYEFIHDKIIYFCLIIVFLTSISAVLIQFILKLYFSFENRGFFENGEKKLGMLTRVLIFIDMYTAYYYSVFMIFIIPILVFFMYRFIRKKYKMEKKYLKKRLILDFIIALIGIIVYIIIQK